VNGVLRLGTRPKTDAGLRTVALPAFLVAELSAHLEVYAEKGETGLVFPAAQGGPMRRSNFRRRQWLPATTEAGLEGLRFHDLRHTASTLAASTGASTKELMVRMGHSSARAALIYQHATAERDAEIAAALDVLVAADGANERTGIRAVEPG
jgi:integrase